MPINTTQLTTDLQTRLNNLTGTETPEEILSLTAALNNLTSDRFMSVTNYSQLPNLTTNSIPSGSLVFVEQFNVLMMSVGAQWRGVDGRALNFTPTTMYSWGRNNSGQLSNNSGVSRSSPGTVIGGIINWTKVSAGAEFTLALTSNGIIYGWGGNSYGQLAQNETTSKSSPVTLVGGITTWSNISAGGLFSLGVTSAGVAYAWGAGNDGALGDGTTTARSSPVTVVGGITTWSQIAAGRSHSLGVTSAGVAYAWGLNNAGHLGDGTTTNRSSPVTVVGGITTWSQVSASYHTSLGVTSTGIAYGWGYNSKGRLGNGYDSGNRSSPVTVVGGITTWSQVSAALRHTLGRTTAGIAYAWGANVNGQLGDNTTVNRSSPVTVVGGITTWSQVSAGSSNFVFSGAGAGASVGLTSTGTAYAWGSNMDGELGDNTTVSRSSPVTVIGGITTWTQISAGSSFVTNPQPGMHIIGLAT